MAKVQNTVAAKHENANVEDILHQILNAERKADELMRNAAQEVSHIEGKVITDIETLQVNAQKELSKKIAEMQSSVIKAQNSQETEDVLKSAPKAKTEKIKKYIIEQFYKQYIN